MSKNERLSRTLVNLFKNSSDYDLFLKKERMETPYDGGRAKGKRKPDGSIVVAIDESYYLSGGIGRDQLPAISEHEITELTSGSSDPHFDGQIAEYQYIRERFGSDGLRKYHTSLCNLMGGSNETRINALNEVLGRG